MKEAMAIFALSVFISCGGRPASTNGDRTPTATPTPQSSGPAAQKTTVETRKPTEKVAVPGTVREFFELLPQEYFRLEGCEPAKDPDCKRSRAEYVKQYLEIEDTKNGYWKSGCDGGQSCLEMAIFKKPDGRYAVLVMTSAEMTEESRFLDYSDGKWTDVGAETVEDYSTANIYQPPRFGTSVEVFKKNFPEPEYSERGAKLYTLKWKDGRFIR